MDSLLYLVVRELFMNILLALERPHINLLGIGLLNVCSVKIKRTGWA